MERLTLLLIPVGLIGCFPWFFAARFFGTRILAAKSSFLFLVRAVEMTFKLARILTTRVGIWEVVRPTLLNEVI
jgi:hypothetical protein